MATLTWITLLQIILLMCFGCCWGAELNYYTKEEQLDNLVNAYSRCLERSNSSTDLFPDDASCPIAFDGAMCWPQTRANSTAILQCAPHVNLFDSSENAYRFCTADGTWITNKTTGLPSVNYTMCMRASKTMTEMMASSGQALNMSSLLQEHQYTIRTTYTVGYCVSLISLIIALTIMILLKRLHCPRNIIHMNMFASFILRGGVALMWEFLIVRSEFGEDHSIEEDIISSTGSWPCKLLCTMWMYTRTSNYVWIFVEGIYLHTLIFINTFSDRSSIKWFILGGWLSPLLSVIPWLLVRIYKDNIECWMIYKDRNYRWIIEVPIAVLIVINTIFFGIIIKLLFTKLRASESSSREVRIYRYIKLAKSTLVLIPLFGVPYFVFLSFEFTDREQVLNEVLEVVRFYFDSFFMSFQGLMVAILFCFLNGEVRGEIIKMWKRWRMMRNMRLPSHTQTNNTTLHSQARSSISSAESIPPRLHSRHPSINSIKSSSPPAIPEESQLLLSIDTNQNELRILHHKSSRIERT